MLLSLKLSDVLGLLLQNMASESSSNLVSSPPLFIGPISLQGCRFFIDPLPLSWSPFLSLIFRNSFLFAEYSSPHLLHLPLRASGKANLFLVESYFASLL